jgi:hypothetical protein
MEVTSSTIINLRFFLRWRDLCPGVNDSVGRLKFSRYGSSDLALLDRSRNNFLGCYVLDNGDSYSRLSSDVDQVVQLFCPDMPVLVILPMLLTTSIATRVHVALALRLKLKLRENLRWYLQLYGSVLFVCLLKNTRLYHKRRKSWKTLKICSFLDLFYNYWRLLMYLYHILFTLINICGIDC